MGRSTDLEAIHHILQEQAPVDTRPAGLTGKGGIGKTRLAIEYLYQHQADYPHGVFWVNAAEPLAHGLARVGVELRPETLKLSLNQQLKAAFEELKQRPEALLVFDNLEDPAQLTLPVGTEPSPLFLTCHILFTTRQPDLERFHSVEVSELPKGPSLQLLLHHPSRHAVRDDLAHPERHEAETICRLLGYLPLALELAAAYLGYRPTVPLAGYRNRLQDEGCLDTLDSEVKQLPRTYLPRVHDAAVAATIKTQWDMLTQDQVEDAKLLLQVAGQFPKATVIDIGTLGLFAGIAHTAPPGYTSPLDCALGRLRDVRLVEELLERHVRLHPLVYEFANAQTPPAIRREFRWQCALRIAKAYEDFPTLENQVRSGGIDIVEQSLITALEFASGLEGEITKTLISLLRLFQQESHHLRSWNRVDQPSYFAQQVLQRAYVVGLPSLAIQAASRLTNLARPCLLTRWRTSRDSPALVRVLKGHGGWVSSVSISPEGRYVVSAGSFDGTVKVWELATGQLVHNLTGHRSSVRAVAVSPDGRHIVSGSHDGTLKLWELASGQFLRDLTGPSGWMGQLVRNLNGRGGPVNSVAFSPNGRYVVSAGSGLATVWDLDTGRLQCDLIGHVGSVSAVAFSSDGRFVVSGSDKVKVWDLATEESLRDLTGHRNRVRSVAVSRHGHLVASGSNDRTAAVWNLDTGVRIRHLTGHEGLVNSVAFSPDGRFVVSGSNDRTVAVWDPHTTVGPRQLTGHSGGVSAVAVSPDGRHIVSGSGDRTVRVWELAIAAGQPLRDFVGRGRSVSAAAVSPDGRQIVSGSLDGTIAVWDLHTGERHLELKGHRDEVSAVVVSPDGRYIVSGSHEGTVKVWELATGQWCCDLAGHCSRVSLVAVSLDGWRIISSSQFGTVKVWKLATGQLVRSLTEHAGSVRAVAVSPNGRHILFGSGTGTVSVWDLDTKRFQRDLTGHRDGVRSVAVSPDGRFVVSGSDDRTVAVWDLHKGKRLRRLTGHQDEVSAVAFSADGRHILSGSGDDTVKIWDLLSGSLQTTISLAGGIVRLALSGRSEDLVVVDSVGNLYSLKICHLSSP